MANEQTKKDKYTNNTKTYQNHIKNTPINVSKPR